MSFTIEERRLTSVLHVVVFIRCAVHGEYRMYQDTLMHLKSWVILWVTVAIVPLGLVVIASGIDLNWIMMCGFILTVPCFPGALLTIIWVRTTSTAMVIGECACSSCVNLSAVQLLKKYNNNFTAHFHTQITFLH